MKITNFYLVPVFWYPPGYLQYCRLRLFNWKPVYTVDSVKLVNRTIVVFICYIRKRVVIKLLWLIDYVNLGIVSNTFHSNNCYSHLFYPTTAVSSKVVPILQRHWDYTLRFLCWQERALDPTKSQIVIWCLKRALELLFQVMP